MPRNRGETEGASLSMEVIVLIRGRGGRLVLLNPCSLSGSFAASQFPQTCHHIGVVVIVVHMNEIRAVSDLCMLCCEVGWAKRRRP